MVGICLTGLEEGLLAPTAEFCREIGLELCAEEGIPVQARAGDRLAVEETDGRVTVTWRTRNEWFRALTHRLTRCQSSAGLCRSNATWAGGSIRHMEPGTGQRLPALQIGKSRCF